MFATGARVGQAVAMHPVKHLRLDDGKAIIPGAKGHDDREVALPAELIDELRALPPKIPRGWERKPANLRVFGYATKCGPLKAWKSACKAAGIAYLPPHSSGRHGFGQEMRVRQGIDTKSVEAGGGWSPQGNMVDRVYTHAEDHESKILEAFRTGRVQAEKKTGLKLAEKLEK
jgi:integrase